MILNGAKEISLSFLNLCGLHILGVPDMAVLETLVNHLRSSSTTCSVIHVAPSCSRSSYAYCPNVELFKVFFYFRQPVSLSND